jgi:hypothetical protein
VRSRVGVVQFTGLALGGLGMLAAAGFSASAIAHVLSVFGFRLPARLFFGLHTGVFVVWAPFVVSGLIVQWRGVEVTGYPAWWRPAVKYGLAYFAAHFAWGVVSLVLSPNSSPHGSGVPALVGRVFSAGWMVFYGIAALGFTALRRSATGSDRGRPTSGCS